MGKEDALRSILFRIDGIQSLKWDNGPTFYISVQAQNTSNQSFTVNSIAGNAYSDGYLICNASLFQSFTIQPNSQQDFQIKIKLNAINAVAQLIEAFQYGHFKKELTIDARANVDNLTIPIKRSITVGL